MTASQVVTFILIGGTVAMAILGAYRGGIRQVGAVAGFLLGFLAARLFSPKVTALFEWHPMISYILIFTAVYISVIILARILRFTVKMLMLGPIDRLIGLLIGVAKWMLLTSLIINFIWALGFHPVCFGVTAAQWIGRFAPKLFGLAQQYI